LSRKLEVSRCTAECAAIKPPHEAAPKNNGGAFAFEAAFKPSPQTKTRQSLTASGGFLVPVTMLRQPQKPTLPLVCYSGFDPF
jgi:hypothetical protein